MQSLSYLIHYLTVTPDALKNRPKILQGPNRNYSKFIVLAHPRSGSDLMIDTLKKHPQIVRFSELFHKRLVNFKVEGYDNRSTKLRALRNKYPVKFLEDYVFSSYRDNIRAVGFKLLPDQIDNNRFGCLWQWLEQNRDLKVISLTRQNLLARYTSQLIAQRDGRHLIKHESERTKTTITIDPNQCFAEFRRREHYIEKIRKCVKRHDVFEVNYEALAVDPDHHLKEAQEFLGVDIRNLKVGTVKQEIRPISEVVDNYDELRQHFLGTKWQFLFDK